MLGWSCAAPSRFFLFPSSPSFFSLHLSLSPFLFLLLSTVIVAVITIFLRPPSGLSFNDLSIEPRAGNHRTSANGTANGCVLLVPLYLSHYTQFSAGDSASLFLFFFAFFFFLLILLPALFSSLLFFLLVLYVVTCAIGRKITFFWRFDWLTFWIFDSAIVDLFFQLFNFISNYSFS